MSPRERSQRRGATVVNMEKTGERRESRAALLDERARRDQLKLMSSEATIVDVAVVVVSSIKTERCTRTPSDEAEGGRRRESIARDPDIRSPCRCDQLELSLSIAYGTIARQPVIPLASASGELSYSAPPTTTSVERTAAQSSVHRHHETRAL